MPAFSTAQSDRELREFLLDPASFPERPARVELVETHISCVFLTDKFVYKLKKPVRFDFLDFSAPELRFAACQEEVRLNRRLTDDVYLGVRPILRGPAGRLELGGPVQVQSGPPQSSPVATHAVDWLVHMRRLPADRTLESLLARGELTTAHVDRIAARLAQFHRSGAPLAVAPAEYVAQAASHVRGNRRDLMAAAPWAPPGSIERVHGTQLCFVELESELLAERVRGGRLVDGHGDLRPEHVYCVEPGPQIVDCVEFQPEFRRLDGADELAFLAMECEIRDAAWAGTHCLAAYCQAMGDAPGERLLRFYKAYRACVRAKVAALRCQQSPADEAVWRETAVKYLRLADATAAGLAQPVMLIVGGISGSGKSTLARALAERLGAAHLSTDAVRQEIFGARPAADRAKRQVDAGIYAPDRRQEVYEVLRRRAAELLGAGRSVVCDGTFLTAKARWHASDVAPGAAARRLLVECACPTALAKSRIAQRENQRGNDSEAFPDLVDVQTKQREPWDHDPPALIVDAARSLEAQASAVLARLATLA